MFYWEGVKKTQSCGPVRNVLSPSPRTAKTFFADFKDLLFFYFIFRYQNIQRSVKQKTGPNEQKIHIFPFQNILRPFLLKKKPILVGDVYGHVLNFFSGYS